MRSYRVALVTGGAGALGSAVVAALRGAGARVVAPPHAELDLRDEEAVRARFAAVAAEHGGIDILVNVAGGFAPGAAADSPWSLWQAQIDINLRTAVVACTAAIPLLAPGAAIVNVASRTALQSGAGVAPYAASKRALLQLTEALSAELRGRDVTVNAVVPSTIDTPANRAAMPDADPGRWSKPADIARAVLFLVGPDARIVTGAAIPV